MPFLSGVHLMSNCTLYVLNCRNDFVAYYKSKNNILMTLFKQIHIIFLQVQDFYSVLRLLHALIIPLLLYKLLFIGLKRYFIGDEQVLFIIA